MGSTYSIVDAETTGPSGQKWAFGAKAGGLVLAGCTGKMGSKVSFCFLTITGTLVAKSDTLGSVQAHMESLITNLNTMFTGQPHKAIGTNTVFKVFIVRYVQTFGECCGSENTQIFGSSSTLATVFTR
mmetsp:Transcript_6405/g.9246  ORF Transcript_6405/g.9246 Transcript_6405/m.9246 type:complete len:128 (+) Transcript_6405:417-800(+)